LARISARGKIISDVDRAESKSRRERHIKEELCGRARECCSWKRSARQLIVSLLCREIACRRLALGWIVAKGEETWSTFVNI